MANKTIAMGDGNETRGDQGFTEADDSFYGDELLFDPEVVDFYDSDGAHYRIDLGRTLGTGGEGIVVVAYDDNDTEYAAKIYKLASRREQNNQKTVFSFLMAKTRESAESYRVTHLMPLLSYGTILLQELGDIGRRDFGILIMPRCECLGDTVQTPESIKGEIIPGIAEALKVLHGQNIVHRDVKPDNIYRYNGVVVLGDYGISTVIDTERGLKETVTNRRTDGYWHSTGVVDCRGDWYSLGYTIWTMYNGNVHPHEELIKNGKLGEVLVGRRVVPFRPKSEEDRSLGDLVYGLTMVVDDYRLGYDDVQKWIKDPAHFEFMDPHEEFADEWRRPYVFNKVKCNDGPALAEALSANWPYALQHLFDGEDLVHHFSRNGDADTSTQLRVIVRDDAGKRKDLGMAKAIYIISDEKHMMNWKGADVSIEALIAEFQSTSPAYLSKYDEVFQSGFLSWTVECGDDADLKGMLSTLKAIETASYNHPYFARCLFQHLFAGGGVSDYSGYASSSELAADVLEVPRRFYRIMESQPDTDEFLAAFSPFFAEAGNLGAVIGMLDKLDGSIRDRAGKILALLDSTSSGNAPVREFAAKFGPVAPWLWMAGQGKYGISGTGKRATAAARAISDIKGFAPSPGDSVTTLAQKSARAKFHADIIMSNMDFSPMAQYLGTPTSNCVVAGDDDSLVCASFYDLDHVPRGFVRSLLVESGTEQALGWSRVKLVSDIAKNEKEYVSATNTACDTLISACGTTESQVGKTDTAIGRFVFDALLALALLFVFTAAFDILSAYEVLSLSTFFMTSASAISPIFTRITLTIMFFFVAFDATITFSNVRTSTALSLSRKRAEDAKNMVLEASQQFSAGSHEYYAVLSDPNAVEEHASSELADMFEKEMSKAGAMAVTYDTSLYRGLWHISAIIALVFFAFAILPTSLLVGDILFGDMFFPAVFLAIVLVVIFCIYAAICHRASNLGIYGWAAILALGTALAFAIPLLCVLILSIVVASFAVVAAFAALGAVFACLNA